MEKFGKSQPAKRREDVRFLTGEGRYVDDIAPANALQCFVFRSPVAHAVITELNVSDARAADGVVAVYTLADLEAAGMNVGMQGATVKNRDGTDGAAPMRPILAGDRLRFVGEPIAVVVAETMAQARDAAEMIMLDYDDLPAKMDMEAGGETVHSEAPDNVAYDWHMGDKDATDAAFAAAARVVSLDVDDNRVIVNSMEPRGC
ncbi:MAG: xanthine dehydrogenase family protein molybdopterin-binding subunit, partial [Pseudomonadota bacterium]